MSRMRLLAIVLLVPFTALTAYALYDVGLGGILGLHLEHSGGLQVFADLVVAILLILCWLVPHARRNGRNPWPYVGLSVVAGSIGPLLYLALTKPAERG